MNTPNIEREEYPEVLVSRTVVETEAESGSKSPIVYRIGECGHAETDPGVLLNGRKTGTLRMRRKLWSDNFTPVDRKTMRCFQCWKKKLKSSR